MIFIAFAGFQGPSPREITCRNCGARIAREEDRLSVMGRPFQAIYLNPLGQPCKIATLSDAANVTAAAFSTEEYTWFEGYAWRPVACASCQQHLGWRYEATAPGRDPRAFFGLLVEALRRPDEPGRDA